MYYIDFSSADIRIYFFQYHNSRLIDVDMYIKGFDMSVYYHIVCRSVLLCVYMYVICVFGGYIFITRDQ